MLSSWNAIPHSARISGAADTQLFARCKSRHSFSTHSKQLSMELKELKRDVTSALMFSLFTGV